MTEGLKYGSGRIHPSISSHLSTELQVLQSLIQRSRWQHRSQPFLQRMKEVLRLGGRIQVLVSQKSAEGTDTSSSSLNDNKKEKEIIIKFIQSILKATISTQQIIQLEHFLPTQISIIAVYGRLFALASNLANHFSLDMEQTLGMEKKPVKEKRIRPEEDVLIPLLDVTERKMEVGGNTNMNMSFDIGQKIERPKPKQAEKILTKRKVITPPSPIRSESMSSSPAPSSPDRSSSPIRIPTPEPQVEKPKLKKKRPLSDTSESKSKTKASATAVKKKKKRDDMDDIFGF